MTATDSSPEMKDGSGHAPSRDEAREQAVAARAQLAITLDALEDQLNVPKQAAEVSRRLNLRVRRIARDNPLALGGIAVGAAAAVGASVWGIVAAASRR